VGPAQQRRSSSATIVARTAATLDDLSQYLEQSGIPIQALAHIDAGQVEPSACAVVVFPDDYDERDARTFIRSLRHARPRLLLIVVTREPNRLEPVLGANEGSLAPVVLPRPSFGWSIVDVIRTHRQSDDA